MQDVLVARPRPEGRGVADARPGQGDQDVPGDLPPGTFTSFKDVEDRWVLIETLEGEPILDRKLAPKGTPAGLVSRIPKGMRAFAVEVNE